MKLNVLVWIAANTALATLPAMSSAAVVVHDNHDQTFRWLGGFDMLGDDFGEHPGSFLDITKSPAEQTGERLSGTFGRWYTPNWSTSTPGISSITAEDGASIAEYDDLIQLPWWEYTMSVRCVRDYAAGEHVSVGDNWNTHSVYFWHYTDGSGPSGIGDPAYLGVRVMMSGQWHYGWILFSEYQWPLAWAYETEPNTPIQIPIPAPSACVVACIACAHAVRRRR